MADLFSAPPTVDDGTAAVLANSTVYDLGHGLFHLKRLASSAYCLKHIERVTAQAPLRHMMTPMGHNMQVKTSNCGPYGWVAQRNGYGYARHDPLTQQPWPHLPQGFLDIHTRACVFAGLPAFVPDACLINRYDIGHAMGAHQDKDEQDLSLPIVSVSLGLSAVFQVFTHGRSGSAINLLLEDGDVVILSGQARSFYHGVKPIKRDPLQPSLIQRTNLTLRKSH